MTPSPPQKKRNAENFFFSGNGPKMRVNWSDHFFGIMTHQNTPHPQPPPPPSLQGILLWVHHGELSSPVRSIYLNIFQSLKLSCKFVFFGGGDWANYVLEKFDGKLGQNTTVSQNPKWLPFHTNMKIHLTFYRFSRSFRRIDFFSLFWQKVAFLIQVQ